MASSVPQTFYRKLGVVTPLENVRQITTALWTLTAVLPVATAAAA